MDNLQHLVSAYFYELWDQHEYRSWEDAVDDFVRRSPDRAVRTPQEIDELISRSRDEPALAGNLVGWGLDHAPSGGVTAWLLAVRDRIRAQVETR